MRRRVRIAAPPTRVRIGVHTGQSNTLMQVKVNVNGRVSNSIIGGAVGYAAARAGYLEAHPIDATVFAI